MGAHGYRAKFLIPMPSRYGLKCPFRHLKKHWRLQRDAPLGAPWSRRIDMLRRGVSYHSYALYPQGSGYLSEVARLDAFFINGKATRDVLNDKYRFSRQFGDRLPIPPILGILRNGALELLHGPLEPWREQGDLIAKPLHGSRGVGVVRLKPGDALPFSSEPLLLTPLVEQAAYAKQIAPFGGNTIRVLTLRDEAGPFIVRAVHRFGTLETAPTDNWSRGSLCAKVDLETGVLSKAVKHPRRTNGALQWVSRHPDTDALIEGTFVPRWPQIQAELLCALATLPELRYVGWDILITEEGFQVLEGNANTEFNALQVHGPLLDDDRVRAFYRHHKIV